ncbi:MAG: protein translocase subunit SecD [Pseudomonadota bacterium]
MNVYPAWKYLVLIVVVVVGIVFALPNIYGDDPAVQISARSGVDDTSLAENVETALDGAGIEHIGIDDNLGQVLARFATPDQQLRAQAALAQTLGDRYVTALNLAPATPAWLREFAAPMFLGLDLRGGVHFLMQVDMVTAIKQAEEGYSDDIREYLRKEAKIRYSGLRYHEDQLEVRFKTQALRDSTVEVLEREYSDLVFGTRDDENAFIITANLTEEAAEAERTAALEQNVITLRNRVNELGVAEPVVQRQGADRIVVQLPGIQDTGRAKEILGATATLEYRLVHGTAADWYSAEESGRVPANARLYTMREDDSPVLLKRQVIVTGDQIEDASAGIDQQSGSPAVFVNLDGKGAKKMQRVTQENVGNLMAVVFIENRTDTKLVDGEIVKTRKRVEEVINAATIRDVLSHRFQTTGLDSTEAHNLALLLRAGALKAPVEIIEERTVGPSLGQDNIEQGLNSVLIGFALVLVFMLVYYRVFGMVANVALTLNLVLIVAVLSMMQATLTLPGIAGIVLTVGMAVDANVLIFERIREELRAGNAVQSSISAGYEKAFSTIADANVTTLIAAIVLFSFGTGPIKGFAITLSIGIVTSMFTAIFASRAIVNLIYGSRKVNKLAI